MTSHLASSSRRNILCRSVRREIALTLLALGVCDCGDSFVPVSPSPDDAGPVAPSPFDSGANAPEVGAPGSDAVFPADAGIADATVDDVQAVADDAAEGADGAAVDGSDGAAEATASNCDATQDPKDEPCVINDAYGVFVVSTIGVDGGPLAMSPSAADAAAEGGADAASPLGTMGNPVIGVGQGISLAVAEGKSRVYICNGQYTESVALTSPVSLYGGLSCVPGSNGWQWAWVGGTANVTAPASTTSGATVNALQVNGLGATPISIEDIAFSSPNGFRYDPKTSIGASSIAAFVTGSTVSFVRVSLTAGRGSSSIQRATQDASTVYPAPAGQADRTPGTITCPYSQDGVTFDSSTGGTGGSLQVNGGVSAGGGADPGTAGTAFPEPLYVDTGALPPADGAGGAVATNGDNGEDGAPRPGGIASPTAGHLSASGWLPATGGAGSAGQPGQGGGGGGTNIGPLGDFDGPGGGAGGCGGAGGRGGVGGGASIALASFASTISLSACTLVTGQGGYGADGEDGQEGQAGGSGGESQPGINGGNGGNGAGGSGGAGGPAGISVGILYAEGPLPAFSTNDTMIVPGAAGIGGVGGNPGAGPGTPGNPGMAGAVDPHASSPYWLAP
jgi:hypothetical protein